MLNNGLYGARMCSKSLKKKKIIIIKKKKKKKKHAGACHGMPYDYPRLTGPIRDRKSMASEWALIGHHGPRATCKQIV